MVECEAAGFGGDAVLDGAEVCAADPADLSPEIPTTSKARSQGSLPAEKLPVSEFARKREPLLRRRELAFCRLRRQARPNRTWGRRS